MAAEHHTPIARRPEGPATMRKLLLLATIALLPATASASTIFTDNTFSDLGSYTKTVGLLDDGASIAAVQCPSCGPTSGQALQITGTFPNAPPSPNIFTALEVLLNPAFTYTPSTQGAITSLSASVDKNLSVNIALTGGGNTFHPTILQGGVLYVASISGPGLNCPTGACATGYNIIASSLTAASFLSFDAATDTFGTGTPNFAGGPMEFGLTQIFGAGAAEVIIADYADLNIAINAVPEPASLAILGVGLLGLVTARRRTEPALKRSPPSNGGAFRWNLFQPSVARCVDSALKLRAIGGRSSKFEGKGNPAWLRTGNTRETALGTPLPTGSATPFPLAAM